MGRFLRHGKLMKPEVSCTRTMGAVSPTSAARATLGAAVLLLSACAHQPCAPVPPDCQEFEAEIARLNQRLSEKDRVIERLRQQKNLQARKLDDTTEEVVRAETKFRALATEADAVAQQAEVEVALHTRLRVLGDASLHPEVIHAQRLLARSSESFRERDYSSAVGLASQANRILEAARTATGREHPASIALLETAFDAPVALRVRVRGNLRRAPGRRARLLAVLEAEALVQGLAYRGDWVQVRTDAGQTGWASTSILQTR